MKEDIVSEDDWHELEEDVHFTMQCQAWPACDYFPWGCNLINNVGNTTNGD